MPPLLPASSFSAQQDCFYRARGAVSCGSTAHEHTSHVTRHTSHVTRHTSHVTRSHPPFLLPKGVPIIHSLPFPRPLGSRFHDPRPRAAQQSRDLHPLHHRVHYRCRSFYDVVLFQFVMVSWRSACCESHACLKSMPHMQATSSPIFL